MFGELLLFPASISIHSLICSPTEILAPTLPRFFLSSWCSGVQSISLSLNGVQEIQTGPSEAVVECMSASFTYNFDSGYVVTLSGQLRVHVVSVPHTPLKPANPNEPQSVENRLKFNWMEFISRKVSKSIAVASIIGTRPYGPSSVDGSSPTTAQGHVSPSNAAATVVPSQVSGLEANIAASGASNSSGVSSSPTLVNGMVEPICISHAIMPPDPVNEFGITQCTMRVLEVR